MAAEGKLLHTLRKLSGVFAVHKPSEISQNKMYNMVSRNILEGLNQIDQETSPNRTEVRVVLSEESSEISPSSESTELSNRDPHSVSVIRTDDLSHNVLVSGPRFQRLNLAAGGKLAKDSSGVLLFGINAGCRTMRVPDNRRKVYLVSGEFGMSTINFSPDGRIIKRTSYDHVTKEKLNHVMTRILHTHQKLAQKLSGVDPNSQEGFEMAAKGQEISFKKTNIEQPIVFNLRCVDYDLPTFTLEVESMFDDGGRRLRRMVHEIAWLLKSSAVCTKVRRVKDGLVTTDHTLLPKHCTLDNIIRSVQLITPLLPDPREDTDAAQQETVPP